MRRICVVVNRFCIANGDELIVCVEPVGGLPMRDIASSLKMGFRDHALQWDVFVASVSSWFIARAH
jgi:hypothetical protein